MIRNVPKIRMFLSRASCRVRDPPLAALRGGPPKFTRNTQQNIAVVACARSGVYDEKNTIQEAFMTEKIVGKSSGWMGTPEEFEVNKGNVGRKKIAFIGASYKFCHRVLRDMMLVGGFNDCQIVMHDIDEVPLKIVGDLMERMARQRETNIKVTRTLDRREALKGADAVVLSITIGGK